MNKTLYIAPADVHVWQKAAEITPRTSSLSKEITRMLVEYILRREAELRKEYGPKDDTNA